MKYHDKYITRNCQGYSTMELTKRVREMSSQLFITQYTLSSYPFAHKQLGDDVSRALFVNFPVSDLQ